MFQKYFQYKGISFPQVIYAEPVLQMVEKDFQVRDDDIFNVTYQKSGRISWATCGEGKCLRLVRESKSILFVCVCVLKKNRVGVPSKWDLILSKSINNFYKTLLLEKSATTKNSNRQH